MLVRGYRHKTLRQEEDTVRTIWITSILHEDFIAVLLPDQHRLSTQGGPTMKLQDSTSNKVIKGIIIVLITTVLFFVIRMDLLESVYTEKSPNTLKTMTSAPTTSPPSAPLIPEDFCTIKPLSPADTEEERFLLGSIAWPETPLLPSPLPLNQTSDPAHSTFTILPKKGGGEWHVGDQLEVMIQMYDFQGNAKTFGGDLLIARLHNRTLEAGVAGQVVDHLNGSYSAVFPLLWEGGAQVEVMLVHSSEAITVLRRLTKEQPDKVSFRSCFQSGSISETTICNVCLRQTSQPQCNFTDPLTGDPWFCYKPKKLSCDTRISHMKGRHKRQLKDGEDKLFQSNINMKIFIKASGPSSVTVLAQNKAQPTINQGNGKPGPSGYYYQGLWQSLNGTRVHQFSSSSVISQCLQGKTVNLYGDSTIRQWFKRLSPFLPDAKKIFMNRSKQTGPYVIWDSIKNTLVTYRCHGPPLSFYYVPISDLHYIANELDDTLGGKDAVVIIGIWAHLCPFPIELYIRRLQSIRRAVVHLLNRAPGTLVVIRTANLRNVNPVTALSYSDWYALQQDKVLRAVFKGLNVRLVDAWEMTLAHHLPHSIHPPPPIIRNMLNVLLSYICPQ